MTRANFQIHDEWLGVKVKQNLVYKTHTLFLTSRSTDEDVPVNQLAQHLEEDSTVD